MALAICAAILAVCDSAHAQTVPAAPTDLSLEAGNGWLGLRWTVWTPPNANVRQAGSHQYRVRTTGSWSGWKTIPVSHGPRHNGDWRGKNAGYYVVSDLSTSTNYSFQVRAKSASGTGGASNVASGRPATSDPKTTLTIERITTSVAENASGNCTNTFSFRIRAEGGDYLFHQGTWQGVRVDIDYSGSQTGDSQRGLVPGTATSNADGNRHWNLTDCVLGSKNDGPLTIQLRKPADEHDIIIGGADSICIRIGNGPQCTSQLNTDENDPLTAEFTGLPASHDGSTAFSFQIDFSEDIATSAGDMRDHALSVSGGTVSSAAQVNQRDDLWSVTVTPSGSVSRLMLASHLHHVTYSE